VCEQSLTSARHHLAVLTLPRSRSLVKEQRAPAWMSVLSAAATDYHLSRNTSSPVFVAVIVCVHSRIIYRIIASNVLCSLVKRDRKSFQVPAKTVKGT